ncbi:hypothetical protein BD779DRAFT_1574556 [Infundibulicybe gibba]|nr:hypothetical protein BD779DRAFT_1574556 [Infundibulicybe gibba]
MRLNGCAFKLITVSIDLLLSAASKGSTSSNRHPSGAALNSPDKGRDKLERDPTTRLWAPAPGSGKAQLVTS